LRPWASIGSRNTDRTGKGERIIAVNIDQIQVGYRYRKDLGDLRALAESIAEVGLLHPVVVTPEGRLIAGQRRLEACRLLEWTEIPVTVVDLYQAARGEAHEKLRAQGLAAQRNRGPQARHRAVGAQGSAAKTRT
jgi:ParB-like chromosome segregation protein Spo0J